MISKIDFRDKKSVVNLLDWQIERDILTVTILAFMSHLLLFQNLYWDTEMPGKRWLHENVLIRDYEGIRQCCTKNFWMYSVTLTANKLVSENIFLTSTLHQAGRLWLEKFKDQFVIIFSSREHSIPKQKITKLLTWQRSPVWKTLHCYREIAVGIFCNGVCIEINIHTKIQCLISMKKV